MRFVHYTHEDHEAVRDFLIVLNRCRTLGAATAFVLSDQIFYEKLGFRPHSRYSFYWKE